MFLFRYVSKYCAFVVCVAAGSTLVADPYYSAIPEVPHLVNTPSIYDVDDSAVAGEWTIDTDQFSFARCYYHVLTLSQITVKRKVLPGPRSPQGGADLRFCSPQPDTSLHCQTTDTGLVYRAVCLFTPQISLVLIATTHGGMARLS